MRLVLVNTPWNTTLQPGTYPPGFYGDAGLNPLSAINSEIGTQLSQLPAASPVSGLIFAFNPSLGPVADPFSCNNNPAPGVIGCMNQFSTRTVPGETLLPIISSSLGHNQAIFTSAGSALGVGDVIFRGKFQAIKRERTGFAIGLDLHTPTGAETDFLGSGAWGIRPFAAFSYSGRVAPHASLGYQINGNSILAGVLTPGVAGHLPNVVSYDAGVDAGVSKRISLSADFLGQSLLRAFKTGLTTLVDFPVGPSTTSITPFFNPSTTGQAFFNLTVEVCGWRQVQAVWKTNRGH